MSTRYLKLGAFVACALLIVFFTLRYDEGRDAIVEQRQAAKVEKAVEKVEGKVNSDVTQSETQNVVYVDRVRTVYKTIYKEAVAHENSGLDSAVLSAGWVRIFNEGAGENPRAVPEAANPGLVDDAAPSGITAAQALTTVSETQELYAVQSRKLIQCQAYVRATRPLWENPDAALPSVSGHGIVGAVAVVAITPPQTILPLEVEETLASGVQVAVGD